MFGYVQIRKPELKIKDFEVYHGFYCGLCSVLKEQYGVLGEITLTYDMTFLVILLSSVYRVPTKRKKEHCALHPVKRHLKIYNEITTYAADLNLLLSYYHFLDDKKDEGSKKAWLGSRLYAKSFRKVSEKYKEKGEQVKYCLNRLAALENRNETDVKRLADCFGRLLSVLFDYKEDAFSGYFRELGYHLGCFIYLMDAYDDLKKDTETGSFNPLKGKNSVHLETWVEEMLLDEISEAAAVFEKLPCIAYRDILRNILYAGVWNRFDQMRSNRSHMLAT